MSNSHENRVVIMGGGTGSHTVATGMKVHPVIVTAIVGTHDSGGSSGVLRNDHHVLPPGDWLRCLLALAPNTPSAALRVLHEVAGYRFSEGGLKGHSGGNLLLAILQKLAEEHPTDAMTQARELFGIAPHEVLPVSTELSTLCARLMDGTTIVGEHEIDQGIELTSPIDWCTLRPPISMIKEARQRILTADAIILAPGDLHTSLIPLLLVKGVKEALADRRGRLIYILPLMTRRGQTSGFTAHDYCTQVHLYLGGTPLDHVIVNNADIPDVVVERYRTEHEEPVKDDLGRDPGLRVHRAPLLDTSLHETSAGDALRRSLVRHDPYALAKLILSILYTPKPA